MVCTVLVLLAAADVDCFVEGKQALLNCSADLTVSVLTWTGDGFDCPSRDSIVNNRIFVEPTRCSVDKSQEGICNETYSANLTCPSEDNGEAVSWLMFIANRTMNGEHVQCSYAGTTTVYPIRVGGKFLYSIL